MSWAGAGGLAAAATKFLLVLPLLWDGVGGRGAVPKAAALLPWGLLVTTELPVPRWGQGLGQGQGQGQGSPPAAEGGGCSETHVVWGWGLWGLLVVPAPSAPPACSPWGHRDPIPPGRGSACSSVGLWLSLVPLGCAGTQCAERWVGDGA